MKKTGILNANLARIVATMGHTDRLVVCDIGFPIPAGKEVVDLALTANVPRFLETLKVILGELQVERAVVAKEMSERSNGVYTDVHRLLSEIEIDEVSHEEFKRIICGNGNTWFVRTGEATPYANIILIAGVTF